MLEHTLWALCFLRYSRPECVCVFCGRGIWTAWVSVRSEAVLERNRRSKAGVHLHHLLGTNRGQCLDCPLFILDMQTYSSLRVERGYCFRFDSWKNLEVTDSTDGKSRRGRKIPSSSLHWAVYPNHACQKLKSKSWYLESEQQSWHVNNMSIRAFSVWMRPTLDLLKVRGGNESWFSSQDLLEWRTDLSCHAVGLPWRCQQNSALHVCTQEPPHTQLRRWADYPETDTPQPIPRVRIVTKAAALEFWMSSSQYSIASNARWKLHVWCNMAVLPSG